MKPTSAISLLCILVAACTSSSDTTTSSSGSGAGSGGTGGASGSCPPTVNHQGLCNADQVGMTCSGIVSCLCNGEGMSVDSSCVCEEGPTLDYQWRCGDECAQACQASGSTGGGAGTGGAGVGGGPPVLGCDDYCAHLLSYPCLGQTSESCNGVCQNFVQVGCELEAQAMFQCVVVARVDCNSHAILGCDPEFTELQACLD